MAKNTLPVDFKDDIMNSAMSGKRRYRMINNSDGTISLEDATTYDQVGSNFGAGQMNATNKAVNAAADASKIIDDIDAIRATTQVGYMAGALALKQVTDSLGEQPTFVYDENGQITGYKTKVGADTVFPFSNGIKEFEISVQGAGGGLYLDVSKYKKFTLNTSPTFSSKPGTGGWYCKDKKFVNTGSATGKINVGETIDISDYTTLGLQLSGSGSDSVGKGYTLIFE